MFQWGGGGLFFRWGASLLSEGRGVHHGGASVLMRGFSEKIVGLRVPPMPPPLWEILGRL